MTATKGKNPGRESVAALSRGQNDVGYVPKKHHLDRRAEQLAVIGSNGADDTLLSTKQLAEWLGVSVTWLEIGRCKNYGPKFQQIGPRGIRYLRADVLKWLKKRTFSCTSEYRRRAKPA